MLRRSHDRSASGATDHTGIDPVGPLCRGWLSGEIGLELVESLDPTVRHRLDAHQASTHDRRHRPGDLRATELCGRGHRQPDRAAVQGAADHGAPRRQSPRVRRQFPWLDPPHAGSGRCPRRSFGVSCSRRARSRAVGSDHPQCPRARPLALPSTPEHFSPPPLDADVLSPLQPGPGDSGAGQAPRVVA